MKNYPKTKPSGIEWIGDIPEHWEKARLAFSGDFFKGKGISKADLSDNGYPVLLYGDIYTKYNTKAAAFVRRIPPELREKAFRLEQGDLLFAASGETKEEIGKCICYTGSEEAYASGDVVVFRQNRMDSEFLAYLFNSYKINQQKAQVSKGEIVVHIYSSQLRDISFPLPPPKEQTTIATYLDRKTAEIDALIADKQRLLQLYEEEKAALINRAVTKGINPDAPLKDSGIEWLGEVPEHWEVKRLKYVIRVNSGFGIRPDQLADDKKYPVYGGNGLMGYTDSPNSEGLDIIIGRVGAKCGNVHLIEGEKWISDNALLATLIRECNEKFLTLQLETMNLNRLANQNAQPLVTGTIIKAQRGVFPPIEEQDLIVKYIEFKTQRIDQQVKNNEQTITLLTEYRTALISEVVTGKRKIV